MKLSAWITAALLGIAPLRAQDDLPRHAPGDSSAFDLNLMLDDSPAVPLPSPAPSPDDHVAQLEAALLQAEQRAAGSEQLFKEGILAKVEVENRADRIVEVRKELADARLAAAAAHSDAVKKSLDAHQASQADLAAAAGVLKTAQQAAAAASADWDRARLDAATLNLQRKRKLYAEGVCSKLEVQEAEDRLALLSGTLPQ